MAKRYVPAPLLAPARGGEASRGDAARAAYSALNWLACLPLVALHEAAHAAAASALGFGVGAAGVVYTYRGRWRGVPVYDVEGFFVLRSRGTEPGTPRDLAVSLAPALWVLPAWLAADAGEPLLAILLALAAATVVSDVMQMFAGDFFVEHATDLHYLFLYGGPEQRQATLGVFE